MKFLALAFLALTSLGSSDLIKISGKYYDRVTIVSKDGTNSKTVYTPIKGDKLERLLELKQIPAAMSNTNTVNQNSRVY